MNATALLPCVQAELAKLSALKADVDDYKGKTLNEISRIVTDINQALKEKKNKLAPQIKDLRTVRLQYQVRTRPRACVTAGLLKGCGPAVEFVAVHATCRCWRCVCCRVCSSPTAIGPVWRCCMALCDRNSIPHMLRRSSHRPCCRSLRART